MNNGLERISQSTHTWCFDENPPLPRVWTVTAKAKLTNHQGKHMETKVIAINRRSANITEGKSRAPNRSMFYAMGYEESDFKKPMIV